MTSRIAILALVAVVGCERASPPAAPPVPTVAAFVDRLDAMSLARHELATGMSAERLVFALFTDADGRVSSDERPTLTGGFMLSMTASATSQTLILHGVFDVDQGAIVELQITDDGDHEVARIVDPKTGATVAGVGDQGKVHVAVVRGLEAAPSLAVRVRIASLWALIGANTRAPIQRATFDAAVLGTHLTRSAQPAMFAPPDGTWVLLKTTSPEELYIAFDVASGRAELFPKTPNTPNDAARALFTAL